MMKNIKYNLLSAVTAFIISTAVIFTNYITKTGKNGNPVLKVITAALISCGAYFIPEAVKKIAESRKRSKKAKELRFLKKLFVISGSVKPADFVRVLRVLIPKSKYYREMLENILENHKRSDLNNEVFFADMLKETEDISAKLFCEKLNMAANYDFDKAVKSIEEDFVSEQREYARFVKKKIEMINIIGVVGMFVIITVLMLWLLGPWLDMLSPAGYI